MKKLFALLIVLTLVAGSVFAGVNYLGVSGGFKTFRNGGEYKCDENSAYNSKSAVIFDAVEGDLNYQYEFDNNVFIYSNTGFSRPGLITIQYKGNSLRYGLYIKDRFTITENLGVGYAINADALRLGFGAGIHYAFMKGEGTINYYSYYSCKVDATSHNLGINVLVDAIYMLSDSVGLEFTLTPTFLLYNNTKEKVTDSEESCNYKASGFALGYAGSATAGITFRF